ncbi:MAG: excinuclease ABC subunit C, partial [Lentisphaeria bacterium]|nr:excinuclease ABC subunit C [Lentisphaeria bacterium]
LLEKKLPLSDLLMVDGGKGQISSAIEALIEVKCPPLPLIGLAERTEEIYVPGRSAPYVLPRSSRALKLLQAVRDEAHRFAITYHRNLRLDAIRNSILDEIPGIGEARKTAILKEFGSVRSLRRAPSPKAIADRVPGIGIEFATIIFDYLKKHQPDGKVNPL